MLHVSECATRNPASYHITYSILIELLVFNLTPSPIPKSMYRDKRDTASTEAGDTASTEAGNLIKHVGTSVE
jgi:hypothetical protein